MTLQNFRTLFNTDLTPLYPKSEINSFFLKLMKHQLHFEIIDVFTKPDFLILAKDLAVMKEVLKRLQQEEPIQYILGSTLFCELAFKVTPDTLIPRPETEELVHWIINETKDKKQNATILDIGTGSGCIAISLKKQLETADVFALDVSKKALEVAKENALANKVSITLIQADVLQIKSLEQQFDIIVSNPPYVRMSEKQEIQNNVLLNEPHTALFVPDDNPLLFYDAIATLAKNHLAKDGKLFFEINQYLADETINLLQQKEFKNVTLKNDLFGNARMLKANL